MLKSVYFTIYSTEKYILGFDSFIKMSIKKHVGEENFDIENSRIKIDDKISLNFPDIKKVVDIESQKEIYSELWKSSYLIV